MLDRLLSLIAPHDCLLCFTEGELLCDACARNTPALPPRCYRCRALSPDGVTCGTCRKVSRLHMVQAATEYSNVAKDMVWKLKFAHARCAVRPMAAVMVDRLVFDEDTVLVHIPTATGRVRQRGFDHAALLGRELGKRTGLPSWRLLARQGQSRQVGATRKARSDHLAGAFRVSNPSLVVNRHIVLVDDVLTTGATLEAAAATLRRAGAQRVDAVVFAQA